jgi:hypothetical protein
MAKEEDPAMSEPRDAAGEDIRARWYAFTPRNEEERLTRLVILRLVEQNADLTARLAAAEAYHEKRERTWAERVVATQGCPRSPVLRG